MSNKSTASKNSKQAQKPETKDVTLRPTSSKPNKPIEAAKPVGLNEPKKLNLKEMIGIIFDSPEFPNECFTIIDETTRVSAFLRHRDTNYLDCLNKQTMEPERIRVAVISAIRYGKSLIFDLLDSPDIIEHIERCINQVDPNLFKELCDFSILKDNRYLDYVKEKDGDDFKSHFFTDLTLINFRDCHRLFLKEFRRGFDNESWRLF